MAKQVNVWDLGSRVQDLFDKIELKLDDLDGRNNMLHREYIAEQRQLLSLAAGIIKDAAKLEHQKRAMTVILDEIAKESLECRERIVTRLKSIKDVELLVAGQ